MQLFYSCMVRTCVFSIEIIWTPFCFQTFRPLMALLSLQMDSRVHKIIAPPLSWICPCYTNAINFLLQPYRNYFLFCKITNFTINQFNTLCSFSYIVGHPARKGLSRSEPHRIAECHHQVSMTIILPTRTITKYYFPPPPPFFSSAMIVRSKVVILYIVKVLY